MRVTADRVALLESYGLTEHQARAYLALIEYPETTAGELAKVSRLSRTRLYDILADLHAVGLVQIYLDGTRKYRAKPISEYLKRRSEELRAHIRDIESRMEILDVAFRPPDDDRSRETGPGVTRALLGRKSVAREIMRMVAEAREDILAATSLGGLQRMVGYLRNGLESAVRSPGTPGPRVALYVPKAAMGTANLEPIEPWISAGIHLLPVTLHGNVLITDGEEAAFIQAIPDDAQPYTGDDFAIITRNPVFVHDYQALLTHAEENPREDP